MSMPVSFSGAPQIWSGASIPMPPQQKMDNLFSLMDTNGDGSISKSELTQAFQTQKVPFGFKKMGPDALYSQLDPNNTGSVSKSDFISKMLNLMKTLRGGRAPQQPGDATQPDSTPNQPTPGGDPELGLGTLVDVYA